MLHRPLQRLRRPCSTWRGTQILERGPRAARRPRGGDGGRALRRAGHHQPPQDRSAYEACGSPSSAPARPSACRRSAALRGLPFSDRSRATSAAASRRLVEAERRTTLLIDTPPELRLQLLAAGVIRRSTRCSTPTSTPTTSTASTTSRVFSVRARAPLPVLRPAGDPGADPRQGSATSSTTRSGPSREPRSRSLEIVPARAGRRDVRSRGSPVLPLAFPHGHLRVFGYRFGPLAYLTDVKAVPEAARRQPARPRACWC